MVNVSAKVKTWLALNWSILPATVELKLLKVVVPVIKAVAEVLKVTVYEPATKPVVPTLLVQEPPIVMFWPGVRTPLVMVRLPSKTGAEAKPQPPLTPSKTRFSKLPVPGVMVKPEPVAANVVV